MAITQAIVDTDILSAVMRKNPVVIPKARAYIEEYGQFKFSIITRYEILRGLKAKGATKQVIALDRFCQKNLILPLTDEIVVRAAEISMFTPLLKNTYLGCCAFSFEGVIRLNTIRSSKWIT